MAHEGFEEDRTFPICHAVQHAQRNDKTTDDKEHIYSYPAGSKYSQEAVFWDAIPLAQDGNVVHHDKRGCKAAQHIDKDVGLFFHHGEIMNFFVLASRSFEAPP